MDRESEGKMIAWIDLETTGLDTECSIIEVACVVTDEKFNEVARFESLVFPPFDVWWEAGAEKMHRESGLFDLVMAERKTIFQVDRDLEDACLDYAAPLILGGQSVHFDRGFIERWMPMSNKRLSHRQIDVSGLKLMWSYALDVPMDALPPFKSKTTHRAMDDILASIDAAHFYRKQIQINSETDFGYVANSEGLATT
jgi:oligoribonuclease